MNRKDFFQSLRRKPGVHQQTDYEGGAPEALPSLNPYPGPWTYETAAHLLRRTTFGPTHDLITQSVTMGLYNTVRELFKLLPLPDPPLRFVNDVNDQNCALGQTWTDVPMNGVDEVQHRRDSLSAWTFMQLFNEGMSIREKLTLFWINHFGCGNNPDVRADYVYSQLLRAGAWGSCKELMKKVTITPAMLHFLNGDVNEVGEPNENFAREFLELFTIGKGPLIAPGDYTNYTEEDVRMLAKSFSGWRIRGFWGADNLPYTSGYFDSRLHDSTTKILSSKFGNTVIPNGGSKEYANVVEIVFQQQEVSHFICRKLYTWFCHYNIDPVIETYIITPMADILRLNNYNIKVVLQTLFKSQHFYDLNRVVGPMTKNPIDFMLSVLKQSHVKLPANWQDQYSISLLMFNWLAGWQMNYYGVPDVAGWKAYYQSPLLYRMWTSASSLQQHQVFVTRILGFGYQVPGEGSGKTLVLEIDPLPLLKIISNPSDPNEIVHGFSRLFFPLPLPQEQSDALKNILLPGLPDFEWTVEYEDYKSDPANLIKSGAIAARIRNLLSAMFMMAENHLS